MSLLEAQTHAAARQGRCLSTEYIDAYSKLKWMCDEGHTWDADMIVMRQGAWCPGCERERKGIQDKAERLEEIRKIAKEKGGQCLSDEYVSFAGKLKFRCSEGHEWRTSWQILKNGSWCVQCVRARRTKTIDDLLKIAKEKGGKCLSDTYLGVYTPMKWQCAEGHIWETKPSVIRNGSWCRQCSNKNTGLRQRLDIEPFRVLAKERGGKLISETYLGVSKPLEWECGEGHRWKAKPARIRLGNWCPQCYNNRRGNTLKLGIEFFQELASEMGGKLLSKEYISTHTPLLWECSKGHQWKAAPNAIKYKHWCKKCKDKQKGINSRLDIEVFRNIAKENGGKLLSDEYFGNSVKLLWECSEGHQWETKPESIRGGSWCGICSNKQNGENRKGNLADCQELARQRGGKLLSEKYTKSGTKMLWQCDKGHQWSAAASAIKHGVWCMKCYRERRGKSQRLGLEPFQKIAEERGGKLLSDSYTNNHTPMLWQCKEGHQWMAAASTIKDQGSWCLQCYKEKVKPNPKP